MGIHLDVDILSILCFSQKLF